MKEIKSLEGDSNKITSSNKPTSRVKSNDRRLTYLANKLEKSPALSKYLTAKDKSLLSTSRATALERKGLSVSLDRGR